MACIALLNGLNTGSFTIQTLPCWGSMKYLCHGDIDCNIVCTGVNGDWKVTLIVYSWYSGLLSWYKYRYITFIQQGSNRAQQSGYRSKYDNL